MTQKVKLTREWGRGSISINFHQICSEPINFNKLQSHFALASKLISGRLKLKF